MAPLMSPTCILPGRPTLNPRWLGFPLESPINLRVPLTSPHLSSHHILTHSSSTPSPPRWVITPGPRRIHRAGLPRSPTTPYPGLPEQLGSLQAPTPCGVSSTGRSLLLRRRLWGRRLRQAEHRAQGERGVVGAGAVIYLRSWTSNQVGKENDDKLNFSAGRLISLMWIFPFAPASSSVQRPCRER